MERYVFHMQIQDGQHEQLQRLNAEYEPALSRAASAIPGLGGIHKFVLGDEYVEMVDYDGPFEDFGRQLASDPEVREFLRAVDGCFVQSLRDMGERRMERVQSLE